MKKILFSFLLMGMLLTFNNEKVHAENLATYKEQIKNGDIRPPHYKNNSISGPNPTVDEWISKVEEQYSNNNNDFMRVEKGKKITINKVDQNGKPIPDVTFKFYKTKKDAELERKEVFDS